MMEMVVPWRCEATDGRKEDEKGEGKNGRISLYSFFFRCDKTHSLLFTSRIYSSPYMLLVSTQCILYVYFFLDYTTFEA